MTWEGSWSHKPCGTSIPSPLLFHKPESSGGCLSAPVAQLTSSAGRGKHFQGVSWYKVETGIANEVWRTAGIAVLHFWCINNLGGFAYTSYFSTALGLWNTRTMTCLLTDRLAHCKRYKQMCWEDYFKQTQKQST